MQGLTNIVFFVGMFSMLSFIGWTVVNAWLRRAQLKSGAAFQKQLLERMTSLSDLNEFLASDAGKRLMEGLVVDVPSSRPKPNILRSAQIGVVLTVLGAGFVSLRWYFGVRYADFGDYEVLTVLAAIALSLGIGFLASTAVSYSLARRLGLFEPPAHEPPAPARV
jgi:hypothetical protein